MGNAPTDPAALADKLAGLAEAMAGYDSDAYRQEFYGILNAQGEFWTPLAFESEGAARRHIENFWRHQPEQLARFLHSSKIVPVRIRLEALRQQENRNG